jgi:hypothetical protein
VTLRVLLLFGLLLAGEAKPAAIVASLGGEAWVKAPSGPRAPLRLFDRLVQGSTLEVGPRSRLVVVFADGSRFQMESGSRGTVGDRELGRRSGEIRALDPLAPVARLLQGENVGRRVAAVRVRALVVTVYPRGCATTLPDETVLRFSATPGDWRVEVVDETGSGVFAQTTEATEVHIPAGKLRPGARYSWRIRVQDATGAARQDEACFLTLSEELLRARSSLKEAIAEAADSTSLALLAELDRSLGLLWEAREGFRAALARSSGDAALRDALARVERDLGLRLEP